MRGNREFTHSADHLHGMGTRGGTVAHTACDTLHDASQTKSVVAEIPVEMRNLATPGVSAVQRDRLFERWYAEWTRIDAPNL